MQELFRSLLLSIRKPGPHVSKHFIREGKKDLYLQVRFLINQKYYLKNEEITDTWAMFTDGMG